ncbi:murein L,D-transpeptidase family protein [Rhizobium sp. BK251]|uniref:L,D-transpeptidase family protein n=1 Tax=Rhizobium sp. BK251 TaxID=2512125 RepID=UPI00104759AF|nr:murein L,D-transpeptidase family protein [Rhizobium sp. BK251]TCL72700.1 murein L,D-transpeptidase YafK [Rhizobium sp. BK251]
MRLRHIAYISLMALALAGCNDAMDATTAIDLSKVKDKVEQPLPPRILAEMRTKGMDRNSPIMIRIFKEEGALEIWKAKTDSRFEKIADYKICAWSGRLGPKVKEGDRQAPEGFYNLTPANLNPYSKYYLAINTGFPNRYDQANGRSGANLMIHGACSSSGCYSMTDEQVLEIYAFARDAFKGGQKSVQLEAFPFRMTAENMVKHRLSPHYDFWKMLKVGYDNFEVTKRPPEVNVCEKKYVFNQQVADGTTFNAAGACPAMSTPPALMAALSAYDKDYQRGYAKAMSKFDGMAWYDPTEAERKAVVAKLRKGRDLAYAPTGTALEAGRLVKVAELEQISDKQSAAAAAGKPLPSAKTALAPTRVVPTAPAAGSEPAAPAAQQDGAATMVATATPSSIPVPKPNPLAFAPEPQAETQAAAKKPFWRFWGREDAPPAPAAAAPAIAATPAAPSGDAQPAAATRPAVVPAAAPAPAASTQPAPAPAEAAAADQQNAPPPAAAVQVAEKKPFWKFWAKQ